VVYGLNTSEVASFAQVNHLRFEPAFHDLGQHLWWFMVQGCIHMPIHNIRRGSNMLYTYKKDIGCSLKWFTASAQKKMVLI
jgi:hypothetical protein